ncbi:MAG: hypothetical protein FWH11_13755 [Micrococcales bacterium]|nr:hypothetical protein [Micrococcales bacterium]
MRLGTSILFGGVCFSVLFLSSGCSADNEKAEGARYASSMSELIRMDLDDPSLSKENRAILESAAEAGAISLSVYEDAAQIYQQCLADLGNDVEWRKLPDGTYLAAPQNIDTMDKYGDDSWTCAQDGFSTIESLYSIQQNNPNLYTDQYEAIYSCLGAKGKRPGGVTLDEFRSELDAVYLEDQGSTWLDLSDPEIAICLQGNGFGIAVEL